MVKKHTNLPSYRAESGSLNHAYPTPNPSQLQPCAELYVENICPFIQERQLHSIFSRCGEVTSLRIVRYPRKKIGFVSFISFEEACHAVTELHGILLGEHQLSVTHYNPGDAAFVSDSTIQYPINHDASYSIPEHGTLHRQYYNAASSYPHPPVRPVDHSSPPSQRQAVGVTVSQDTYKPAPVAVGTGRKSNPEEITEIPLAVPIAPVAPTVSKDPAPDKMPKSPPSVTTPALAALRPDHQSGDWEQELLFYPRKDAPELNLSISGQQETRVQDQQPAPSAPSVPSSQQQPIKEEVDPEDLQQQLRGRPIGQRIKPKHADKKEPKVHAQVQGKKKQQQQPPPPPHILGYPSYQGGRGRPPPHYGDYDRGGATDWHTQQHPPQVSYDQHAQSSVQYHHQSYDRDYRDHGYSSAPQPHHYSSPHSHGYEDYPSAHGWDYPYPPRPAHPSHYPSQASDLYLPQAPADPYTPQDPVFYHASVAPAADHYAPHGSNFNAAVAPAADHYAPHGSSFNAAVAPVADHYAPHGSSFNAAVVPESQSPIEARYGRSRLFESQASVAAAGVNVSEPALSYQQPLMEQTDPIMLSKWV